MTIAIEVIAIVSSLYQITAILAIFRHLRQKPPVSGPFEPFVSILKPVHGLEEGFYEALRSHATQIYPGFELLLGVRDLTGPAALTIKRFEADFPSLPIRSILCETDAPNPKVGALMDLARYARGAVLIVNDADIRVPSGYVRGVVSPLSDADVGLVTCLYRAESRDGPGRWEALGVATEFAPSTLVATLAGVSEFGMGSTLAFRREDLDAIGGFGALRDYLADDYQLGAKIHALGRRNMISHIVVTTRLDAGSWRAAWKHQVRWARTVRVSRLGGYLGLPITFTTLWAVLAGACGAWQVACFALSARLLMAVAAGWGVLHSPDVLRYCFLIPIRDLWGVLVWATGAIGNTVEWRGRKLRLDREGRIMPAEPTV